MTILLVYCLFVLLVVTMHYPQHLAIIPDGNRTWAKDQGLSSFEWHAAGQQNSLRLAKYIFQETPISVLTLWWLSTENLLKRSKEELDYLSELYRLAIEDVKDLLLWLKVSFYRVWNAVGMPASLLEYLQQTQEELQFDDTDKSFVVAVNYWWRDEIVRGIHSLSHEETKTITADEFSKKLDFGKFPPVDLVIRTKWDKASRVSWFMLWWIGYAELFFSKLKFPAFGIKALEEALHRYDSVVQRRNFWK